MLACTLWHERACTQISVTLGMHKHHTHLGPWKKAIPLDDAFLRYRLFSLVNLLSHALFCSCIILQSAGLCVIVASAYIYAISVLQVPGSLINVKLPWSFLTLSRHVIFAPCEGWAQVTSPIALFGYPVIFHSSQVSNARERLAMIHRFFK